MNSQTEMKLYDKSSLMTCHTNEKRLFSRRKNHSCVTIQPRLFKGAFGEHFKSVSYQVRMDGRHPRWTS